MDPTTELAPGQEVTAMVRATPVLDGTFPTFAIEFEVEFNNIEAALDMAGWDSERTTTSGEEDRELETTVAEGDAVKIEVTDLTIVDVVAANFSTVFLPAMLDPSSVVFVCRSSTSDQLA